ncbi:F-box associated interaction domain [Arabidopsis thaliana x Arabidopsis arenosa]|uniref:F-box associated interaction domain n=1 Tax=Arabidopsis thaliana x Arabidopsis arenosa TaxID=1240361 RepID=A0A8T2BEL2_9BRAS|nr:F-box associated interaction domain [Arabidopsis thaliana x Arabidopsis arenosa]
MKTERQNVSEDLVVVTERNKRAKTSNNGGEPIPFDLTVEICSRLPAKSISRFRCVSKLWGSILGLPYFTELFLTRSLARPQLLFACRKDNHVFVFSSLQPQNLDDNNASIKIPTLMLFPYPYTSSLLAANYHMKIPYYASSFKRCSSVRGLIFLGDERSLNGVEHKVSVICNPSTGESLTLPKLKTRKRIGVRSYFGYEPIEKQYKVLSMTWGIYGTQDSEEHQVLTLGTRQPSWRMIECWIPHSLYHTYNNVCINGVLYYPAVNTSSRGFIIVSFDFRSEEFRFVEDTDTSISSYYRPPLINYNGKLGSLGSSGGFGGIGGSCTSITLRVLEDAEKHEWSEHIYVLPTWWKYIFGGGYTDLCVVGVTRTNEIVLSCPFPSTPFYVFYYNTERNAIRRVEIQGLEAFKGRSVYTFLDHVENVNMKLMDGL